MNTGINRIVEEFKDLNRSPIANCGICVGLFNDGDYSRWKCTLIGPKDSSYSGGLFLLSIKFPPDYPNKAPEVCFLTPIYHINVNPRVPRGNGGESLGHVCISTLNWWKPIYKMREVLTNIFALFYLSNPKSPYGLERAEEFNCQRAVYEEKAKYFTRKYAHPNKASGSFDLNNDWNFNYP